MSEKDLAQIVGTGEGPYHALDCARVSAPPRFDRAKGGTAKGSLRQIGLGLLLAGVSAATACSDASTSAATVESPRTTVQLDDAGLIL
jgi:hypothetical protein